MESKRPLGLCQTPSLYILYIFIFLFHTPFLDIEKINVCKFVHKQRNNKTPKIFNDLFTENKDIHKYNTRQSHNLATPLATTNFSQKTIDFRGPRTWNSIPMKIRKLKCNKHFGKKLRTHLIDKLTYWIQNNLMSLLSSSSLYTFIILFFFFFLY